MATERKQRCYFSFILYLLKLRENWRNIVGKQLPTLLGAMCCISCCAKFKSNQTFESTIPSISFASSSLKHSATMLDPFAQRFSSSALSVYTWSPWTSFTCVTVLLNLIGRILPIIHCKSRYCWGLASWSLYLFCARSPKTLQNNRTLPPWKNYLKNAICDMRSFYNTKLFLSSI